MIFSLFLNRYRDDQLLTSPLTKLNPTVIAVFLLFPLVAHALLVTDHTADTHLPS
jgi:hypothetical protein